MHRFQCAYAMQATQSVWCTKRQIYTYTPCVSAIHGWGDFQRVYKSFVFLTVRCAPFGITSLQCESVEMVEVVNEQNSESHRMKSDMKSGARVQTTAVYVWLEELDVIFGCNQTLSGTEGKT